MAVRFVKPIQTPYESQFVPMPLEFMYKGMEEKQKGLDTTRGLLSSANLNLDGAIWDIEQGNVARKKSEYLGNIDSLTKQLSENKESFNAVAQNLGAVNRKYNNDPEVQRILKHKEYYDKNVLPHLGKPNAASLYFRNLMDEDPKTGQWNWKKAEDIQLGDIRTPIEDKTVPHVMENFGQYLTASVKEKLPGGYSISTDPTTGMYVIKEPGGTTVTDLNLKADLIRDAVKKYSRVLKNEETDQAHYIKEYLPNSSTGKRGYKTEEDIEKFVTDVVSSRFFTKEDFTKPEYQFVSPKTSDSSGGGTDVIKGDFLYNIESMPIDMNDPNSYINLKNITSGITTEQIGKLDNLQKTSLETVTTIDQTIPGLNLSQQVTDVYAKTGDPIKAAAKATQLILSNFNNLSKKDQDRLQPTISAMTKDLEEVTLLEQKKVVYSAVTNYVDQKLTEEAIPKESLNKFKKEVNAKLGENLTESEKNDLARLIALRKTAAGGISSLWAGPGELTTEQVDAQIAKLLGYNEEWRLTDNEFFEPLISLSNSIDSKKVDDYLAKGIKVDANALYLGKLNEIDTVTEEYMEGLRASLKGATTDAIARTAGFTDTGEFLKGIIFKDKELSETEIKDLDFLDLKIVDNPNGGMPSALYSFAKGGSTNAVVQVLAPLVSKDTKNRISSMSKELFIKGLNERSPSKQEAAARLYAASNMSEIDYNQIMLMMRLNVDEGDDLTFNFANNPDFTVTKSVDGYTVNIPGGTPKTITNPNALFTIVGSYLLNEEARRLGGQGGTSSVGKPTVGAKVR